MDCDTVATATGHRARCLDPSSSCPAAWTLVLGACPSRLPVRPPAYLFVRAQGCHLPVFGAVRRDVPDYTGPRLKKRGSMALQLCTLPARPNKKCKEFNAFTKTYFGGDKEATLATVQKRQEVQVCALSRAHLWSRQQPVPALATLGGFDKSVGS